jgi:hypothetical protein
MVGGVGPFARAVIHATVEPDLLVRAPPPQLVPCEAGEKRVCSVGVYYSSRPLRGEKKNGSNTVAGG